MSSKDVSSWLPNLLGVLDLQQDGADISTKRSKLNLIGATVADDADNDRTNVTITGGGGGTGSNLGTALRVFKDVSGGALRHRTLRVAGNKSGEEDPSGFAGEVHIRPVPPGHYNPCDYGATPSTTNVWDSVQDDTAFLQAALDAPAKGGVIQIPAGNYFISAPLNLQDFGTHIVGCGSLYNLDHSVVIHATAPMPYMLGVFGRATIDRIYLDCAYLADCGIGRFGDGETHYNGVTVYQGKVDGWHSFKVKPDYVLSAVTPSSGGLPAVTVTGYPNPAYGGAQSLTITNTGPRGPGGAQFTYNIGYGDIGPYEIPTSGLFQLQLGDLSIGAGILVTFPAGTYTSGDSYSWTMTATGCLNDGIRLTDCNAFFCGNVYATANFTQAGPGLGGRDVYELTALSIHHSAVSGTVTITSGSQIITGSGTSFIASKARPGDFIRCGAYPDWQPSHTYMVGDIVVASAAVPGQAYVWRAESVSGNTGPVQPQWPVNSGVPGSMPIYQGVGTSIVDGGVIWRCHNPGVYQILSVRDDDTIVIATNGTPINTESGLDYAIHVGSGLYEELAGDANTSIFDGGNFNGNAACGACCTSDFSDHYLNGQYSDNGVCGIAVGISPFSCYDTLITGTYMEGNLCANFILGFVNGVNIISPIQVANNCCHIMDLGSGSTWGVWHGSNGYDPRVAQPIGTIGYSEIPVTQTAGRDFTIRGPMIVVPVGVGLGDGSGSYNIDPTSSIIQASINSPGYLVTANPTILPGSAAGQVVRIFNNGSYPFTLDATKGMTLESPFVTIESTNSIDFFWDGFTWRQLGSIGRGTGRPFGLTVADGANEDVGDPGNDVVEADTRTGAWSIGGIAAGRNLRTITILNTSGFPLTLTNESGGSTAANRITVSSGADYVVAPGAVVQVTYSEVLTRWLIVGDSEQKYAVATTNATPVNVVLATLGVGDVAQVDVIAKVAKADGTVRQVFKLSGLYYGAAGPTATIDGSVGSTATGTGGAAVTLDVTGATVVLKITGIAATNLVTTFEVSVI